MQPITNIEGLSGEEEKLAVDMLNSEMEERLSHGLCPNCGKDGIIIYHEPDGPDDYITTAYCHFCREQIHP